jgi:hypothetical protein
VIGCWPDDRKTGPNTPALVVREPASAGKGCEAWPMLGTALAFTSIPVLAAAGSGVVASLRRPGLRLTSGLQHFAAGVVFAAAAVELLPPILEQSPMVAIVGFGAGIVLDL